MKEFREFGHGGPEFGCWDENFHFEDPNDRGGACAYFDAWSECNSVQMRIWHIDKDLKATFTGDGFKITKSETKFYPDDIEGKDSSSYCTFHTIKITKLSGHIEVTIPNETTYDDNIIRWGDGKITDFYGKKAHFKKVNDDHYKFDEILTNKQKQYYVMQDRYYKLLKIAHKMNRPDIHRELNFAHISGDFDI
jgi:hypothetical protein